MNAPFDLLPTTVQYFITTDVDPGAISRVVELFALRGITPNSLKVHQYKKTPLIHEKLSIDIRISNLSEAEQNVIFQKLQAQVCVQTVRKEVVFKNIKAA